MQKWKTPRDPIRDTREQLEEELVSARATASDVNRTESKAGIRTQER